MESPVTHWTFFFFNKLKEGRERRPPSTKAEIKYVKNADDEAGASVRESEEESVKEEETSRGAAISDRTNV